MLKVILSVWICVCTACVDAGITHLTFLLHLPSLFSLSILAVFSPDWNHYTLLWEDHARLFNVSTSFVLEVGSLFSPSIADEQ